VCLFDDFKFRLMPLLIYKIYRICYESRLNPLNHKALSSLKNKLKRLYNTNCTRRRKKRHLLNSDGPGSLSHSANSSFIIHNRDGCGIDIASTRPDQTLNRRKRIAHFGKQDWFRFNFYKPSGVWDEFSTSNLGNPILEHNMFKYRIAFRFIYTS